MNRIKLANGEIFEVLNASETTELAEGKTRAVMNLEFSKDAYTTEHLRENFGDESATQTLLFGVEKEEGVEWYEAPHKNFTLLLSCGFTTIEVGTDEETGAKIYEEKLLVKMGKRIAEEIDLYNLKQAVADLETALVELAFGGEY